MNITLVALASFFSFSACTSTSQSEETPKEEIHTEVDLDSLSRAYFASGCFWCVEAIYQSVNGVEEAISGYSGGHTADPTYRSIGTGTTGHSESVEVYYNSAVVSYETLVEVYYGSHDPTTVNGQSPDFGTQYRSIIFYQNEEEKKIAESFKARLDKSGNYDEPIATEIIPFEKFYAAEDYHQNYERLHPNESYVRNISIPRLHRFKDKFPHLLKEKH